MVRSGFAQMDLIDGAELGAYMKSFGSAPSGTKYYDPSKTDGSQKLLDKRIGRKEGQNMTQADILMKAFEAKDVTNSTIMDVPVVWDREIVDTVRKETPVVEMIRRVSHVGAAISYNRLTAIADAVFYTEADSFSDEFVKDTYQNVTDTIKLSRTGGQVTGFAQAALRHFVDIYAERVRNAVYAMKRLHENTVLYGDGLSGSYEGIVETVGQIFYSTDTGLTGGTSVDITADQVRDAYGAITDIRRSAGVNVVGITDYKTANVLKAELMDSVKYIDTSTPFMWGIRGVFWIEEVPVVVSKFMTKTDNEKDFILLDLNYVEYKVLQEMNLVEYGIRGDGREFMLKEYSTFINKYPNAHGIIRQIK